MYRILGKRGWQTNGLYILPWMSGMVDVCIILQTLAGGVRHPSLHCTAAVAMMVNSMQGSCNATAAELLELKGTDGSMEQELGCRYAVYFSEK